MTYFIPFLLSFILSLIATYFVKKIAWRFSFLDNPDRDAKNDNEKSRKIHTKTTALLGGSAIFISFFTILFLFSDKFLLGDLNIRHLLGFFIGALFIIIGGALDDKYNLSPGKQIIFPILAVLSVVLGGVEISRLSNPFGGVIDLSVFFWISPILIFVWLMGMMYTTKLLDGVDGLVSGIGLIASLIIFLFTLSPGYFQPDIALAAIIFCGAIAGFLVFNWHPAKIFLGEGGSLLIGFVLGVFSVISGAKIAIALLVMGIPILDVLWTIIRRTLKGKNPFRFSDRKHLHHRLLDSGLNQPKTVLVFCFLSFTFGFSGLFLQSQGKFLALILLSFLMFFIVLFFSLREKKHLKFKTDRKPSLLFQVCCAPCASFVSIDILIKKYDLTWYFCNPNLFSREEYEKRLEAVRFIAEKFKIKLIVDEYNHEAWLNKVKGLENEPEKGKRCFICYYDRLLKTASLAKQKGFDFFGTSLSVSPFKDLNSILNISHKLSNEFKVGFLPDNLRSSDIFKKSQELAKKEDLYRQNFCGCEFSLRKK